MNYTQNGQYQISFWYAVLEEMNVETQEIVANLLICGLIASLAIFEGANSTFTVGAIAFVQSVNIPRAIRAYRQAKFKQQGQYTDD